MIIVGITGTNASGKEEVAKYFQEKGFIHYSMSGYITSVIEKAGGTVNRDELIRVGNELRKNFGPGHIAAALYTQACEKGKPCIIESLRTVGEIEILRKIVGERFLLLGIDADRHVRYHRAVGRKSAKDNVTFEEFMAQEEKEWTSTDPHKQNLAACLDMVDELIVNNTASITMLREKVDKIMLHILAMELQIIREPC